MGSSCSSAASWGVWVMLEEVSLQPWFISKPPWEWRWALRGCGHSHTPTCGKKVAAGSSHVDGTGHPAASPCPCPSQGGHPLPPAQPGSAGCGTDWPFPAAALPSPARSSPQRCPGQHLHGRLGTAAVVCRAAAPTARPEPHTQQNPNLPKKLNKLPGWRGSRAGTQIPSSCLSHE